MERVSNLILNRSRFTSKPCNRLELNIAVNNRIRTLSRIQRHRGRHKPALAIIRCRIPQLQRRRRNRRTRQRCVISNRVCNLRLHVRTRRTVINSSRTSRLIHRWSVSSCRGLAERIRHLIGNRSSSTRKVLFRRERNLASSNRIRPVSQLHRPSHERARYWIPQLQRRSIKDNTRIRGVIEQHILRLHFIECTR